MRTRVSDKKRNIIIAVSVILCLLIISLIVWKMGSLTRDVLNNDDIRANVDCVGITALSDASVADALKNSASSPIEISDDALSRIEAAKGEACVINLKYSFYNNTGKEIKDFSMNIVPIETTLGEIYACSALEEVSCEDNLFTFTQSIVAHRADIDDVYFTSELPLGFEANYRYELSYFMSGQFGRKTLSFSTAKRED